MKKINPTNELDLKEEHIVISTNDKEVAIYIRKDNNITQRLFLTKEEAKELATELKKL